MATIIGIAGRIGDGKDAIASRLVERWGFKVIRFSDALKAEVLERLPVTLAAIYRQVYEVPAWKEDPSKLDLRWMVCASKPPIIRALLQEYGTDVRRADDPDYWVEKWVDAVYGRPLHTSRIVAPDMRFPNEWEAVNRLGGFKWRVTRPDRIGEKRSDHASETSLDGHQFDIRIANDGTLDQLHRAVDDLVGPILG